MIRVRLLGMCLLICIIWLATDLGLLSCSALRHHRNRDDQKPSANRKPDAQSGSAIHDDLEEHESSSPSILTSRCGDTRQVPYTRKGSPSTPLPEAAVEDRCKGSTSLGDRFVVTTTYKSPVDWLQKEISVPSFVYYAGGVNETHRHANVGMESTGYLSFIAEYYNCLPKNMLFVHPHMASYHSHRRLNETLDLVRWDNIPGFATMHPFGANWAEYNPSDPVSNLGQPLASQEEQAEVPCDQVLNGTAYEYWAVWNYRRAQWISKAWDLFFDRTVIGRMPAGKLRMALTAEFFVQDQRVLGRPRQFYLQAIQWISDTVHANEFNNWEVAVVFEMLWHYIFQEPAFLPSTTVDPCVLYRCPDTATQ